VTRFIGDPQQNRIESGLPTTASIAVAIIVLILIGMLVAIAAPGTYVVIAAPQPRRGGRSFSFLLSLVVGPLSFPCPPRPSCHRILVLLIVLHSFFLFLPRLRQQFGWFFVSSSIF